MSRLNKIVKTEAYRIVCWQLMIVMGLALIVFLLKSLNSGLSTLMGGLAYGLPNLAFVWRVFDYTGARSAGRFLMAFVLGEAFKLILSAILFVVAIQFFGMQPLYALLGFAGAIVAFWVAAVWFGIHERGVS